MDSVNTPRSEADRGRDYANIGQAAARLVVDLLKFDNPTARATAREFAALAARVSEYAGDNAVWPAHRDAAACEAAADDAVEAYEAAQAALLEDAETRAMKAINQIKNPIRGFEAREMFERVEGHDFEAIESAVKYIEELAAIDKEDHK